MDLPRCRMHLGMSSSVMHTWHKSYGLLRAHGIDLGLCTPTGAQSCRKPKLASVWHNTYSYVWVPSWKVLGHQPAHIRLT